MTLTTVADPEAATEACAQALARHLRAALAARGAAHLALNGGSTPRPVYERLPALLDDWSAVHIWFGDERCVAPDDEASNYRLAAETLIPGAAIAADRVHRMRGELGPHEGARAYGAELAEHLELDDAGMPVLDVIHLGLGPDGHTASLFPDHSALRVSGLVDGRRHRLAEAAAGADLAEPRLPERGAALRAAHRRRRQARRGRPRARPARPRDAGLAAGARAPGADRRRRRDAGHRGLSAARRGGALGCGAMKIEGAGALVVGGASGLGEATARRLHAEGAKVTIADVNAEKGDALADELGAGAQFVAADVTKAEEVEAAVDAAAELAGGELRISMHCAGVGWAERTVSKRGPHQLEFFEKVIQINLIGTFNALRLAAAKMAANEPDAGGERGVCVNTASIAAYDGQIGQIAYSASKGGVVGMTLPAARDLSSLGIRVCTIAPGLFDTPLLAALPQEARDQLGAGVPFPKRLGLPAEYADLAAFIIGNTMMNGEVVRLDGALRMPPK